VPDSSPIVRESVAYERPLTVLLNWRRESRWDVSL
jgi:hypothetical protein